MFLDNAWWDNAYYVSCDEKLVVVEGDFPYFLTGEGVFLRKYIKSYCGRRYEKYVQMSIRYRHDGDHIGKPYVEYMQSGKRVKRSLLKMTASLTPS